MDRDRANDPVGGLEGLLVDPGRRRRPGDPRQRPVPVRLLAPGAVRGAGRRLRRRRNRGLLEFGHHEHLGRDGRQARAAGLCEPFQRRAPGRRPRTCGGRLCRPGVPNWLATACHPEGSIALRWFFATAPLPEADIRVVPLDQVAALPWSSVPRAGGKGCGLHTFKCVYRGSRPDTEDLFGDAGEAQEPEIGTTGGRQLDSYREPVIGESGG